MNTRTLSLTLGRAITLAAMTAGMASAALAQQANTSTGSSNGVTNMSAPKSVAPVSVTAAPTPTAAAQAAVTQTQNPSNASLTPPATNRVGDATNYLLKLQADGQHASRNAYPVTSDVAQRSYTRYLESFTHKIPESADSQVGSKSGGSK
ncbi:DUF3613 domain-containing protein [Comamonas sp. Y33R10-2]|uniref:DUF3613 domain-containing protein n=1 Tax=Comamonas sp. Y33R10-2 TaxID=2853257 RepID=UPI001C5CAF66|nr:DUF3613 domain-containing protein [Comamonas sp. Y33R10-2]QXZ09116.1 DUF3613 domain-containing protein [Comamonas sp. Y33R10-2]